MLSDELVPHADSNLAALAKHLEAKLSFGELTDCINTNLRNASTKVNNA